MSASGKTWEVLCGWVLAIALALCGCGKSASEAKTPPTPKRALYRGAGFWFQDLVQRFHKAVNPPGKPPLYELIRLPDFDPLTLELYQQTALILSSFYPMTDLSFGARASEMLQAVDVMVTNTAWVEEFARNGWLAPFDEAALGPALREAGIEPIRVSDPGDPAGAGRIYGIPISRGADFLFYRKSYFQNPDDARRAWLAGMNGAFPPKVPPVIAADGQELFRFFLPLVWSLEPDWPRQSNGVFLADTPAARAVLAALRRSLRIAAWPSAAERMSFLVDLKGQINSFAAAPRPFDPAAAQADGARPPAAWLLSTWAQRILITPWGPPAPLSDVGILPLSVSSGAAAPGYSLQTGRCIICSRQMVSEDPAAQAARETITALARWLVSEAGQRAMCFDQFEIPARRGLLRSLTDDDVAAVFGSRREWCDYETYLKEIRAGTRQVDERSRQLGRETLALLREIEATLEDPRRVMIRPGPLTINQKMVLDMFLHGVLGRSPVFAGMGVTPPAGSATEGGAERDPSVRGLQQLQTLLETKQRFIGARPAATDRPAAGALDARPAEGRRRPE